MLLTLSHHDGYVLAKTGGALDESAREVFRQQLHPLFGQRPTKLILDLAGSPRINSAGVGNLVALVADANTNSGRVILCGLTPFVAGVMSVTKLNQYFTLTDTVDEAIAKVSAA